MHDRCGSSVSPAQIAQYRSEGWTSLGRVLDDDMLALMRDEEARFRGDPAGQLTIFRSQLAHHSPVIRSLAADPGLVAGVRQLIGADSVALWFNQFVTKLPDAASGRSEFPWHQDNGYVEIIPASNVTVWIALDDVDERNGCVWVMPRSHQGGLLEHKTRSADSWHLAVPVQGDGVPAVLKAGEAVAFTGLTLHRSKLNQTSLPRRAFFLEYADADATFRRGSDTPQPILTQSNTWVVAGRARWRA